MKTAIIFLCIFIPSIVFGLTLTWQDNSAIEDEFVIEQLGPGGWVEIARVLKDVTTYVDTATQGEGAYRVKACNSVGCSMYASGVKINAPTTILVQDP